MKEFRPSSDRELSEALTAAARARETIALEGAGTKRRMNHAGGAPDTAISTAGLSKVLQYEPRDLTISVEAGLPFAELSAQVAEKGQMIPFDPPYFEHATVGGVVAANTAGPRRRLYGSVRDFVIGMTFATLDGKLVKSGGMVVKNVAGFDMAKLMIGSFGTLAALASVNFKLAPVPPETRTFVLRYRTAAECSAARDAILRGVLQPAAIDALNPAAAQRVGLDGFVLFLQAGGNPAVLARYARELQGAEKLEGGEESELWAAVREFTPQFVTGNAGAQVARVSAVVTGSGDLLSATEPVVARAGSGIAYVHFDDAQAAAEWRSRPEAKRLRYVFEYGEPHSNGVFGSDFDLMKSVKAMFDPEGLLNPGRLYGRI